ncbi:MAG: helix-turn-helix domain-containing protein [Mycobacterium sp.]|nr:helix-turn-helix domain-containing protein [Mycobacterium sp.]
MKSLDAAEFARRLNRLFETVHPPGREPYCDRDVVNALALRGLTLSAPYLSQLRRGQRTNPSYRTVEMIAEFFSVPTDYFAESVGMPRRRVDEDLHWLGLSRDPDVRSLIIALKELPPETCERLLAEAEARESVAAQTGERYLV